MYPTDMVAVLRDGSSATVGDYWASSYSAPSADTSRDGGVEDYTLVSGSYLNGLLTATFDRKLDTGDKWDHTIVMGEKIDYVWARHRNDDTFKAEHSRFGKGSVTLAATAEVATITSEEHIHDDEDHFETHGTYMTIMWFVLVHLGVISARYLKFTYWWYWIHLILTGIVTVVTLISALWAYDKNESSQLAFQSDEHKYHSRLGLAITSLIMGQAIMGLLTRFNIWCNKSNVHVIGTLRYAHQLVGTTLLILSAVQIWYGYEAFNDEYDVDRQWITYMFWWILLVLYAVLELNHQLGVRYLIHPLNECRRCALPEMTHAEAMQKIALGKKLVFYDELVLDVGNFRWSHPGGSIMFENTIGQDMGKFLHGSSSIGGSFNAYNHSHQALKLARQLAIAKLPMKQDKYAEEATLTGETSGEISIQNSNWQFKERKLVANSTYHLSFSNDSIAIPSMPSGVGWIGTHFAVTIGGITRYYSFTLALSPEHEEAYDPANRGSDQAVNGKSSNVNLFIKVYPKGQLTQKLLNAEAGVNVRLKGPMGPGLMLTPTTSGRCIGFGGGTGIIPFLDLVEILYWRKLKPERYGDTLKDLQLTLWVGFQTDEDVFANKLLTATQDAYKDDDTFQLHQQISSKEGRINQEIVSKLTPGDASLVWICGPSPFNASVRDMVSNCGVRPEAIIVL